MATARRVTALGQRRVKPSEYFMLSAQTISSAPAITKESQASAIRSVPVPCWG